MTRPLIDADVLRYEVGAIGEMDDEVKSFDFVAEVLDGRVSDIIRAVGGTAPPTMYLTGKENFRDVIAVTKPYKGNRKGYKPFHFDNLTAYIKAHYDTIITEGIEADDAMAIEQTQSERAGNKVRTVICTRDKDLRMVPGLHYGWECGKQLEYRLREITDPGWVELDDEKSPPKLTGGGMLFFYSQLLTGDSTDNIPGLPRCGPVKAYDILKDCETEVQMWKAVRKCYRQKRCTDEYIMEQAYLLWMVRELDEEGNPVMWVPPE